MHKNIGGFKFGDLVAHRQTAKLNVSPIFLRLRYSVLACCCTNQIVYTSSKIASLQIIGLADGKQEMETKRKLELET